MIGKVPIGSGFATGGCKIGSYCIQCIISVTFCSRLKLTITQGVMCSSRNLWFSSRLDMLIAFSSGAYRFVSDRSQLSDATYSHFRFRFRFNKVAS